MALALVVGWLVLREDDQGDADDPDLTVALGGTPGEVKVERAPSGWRIELDADQGPEVEKATDRATAPYPRVSDTRPTEEAMPDIADTIDAAIPAAPPAAPALDDTLVLGGEIEPETGSRILRHPAQGPADAL